MDNLLASSFTILDGDPRWNPFDRTSGPLRSVSLVYDPTATA